MRTLELANARVLYKCYHYRDESENRNTACKRWCQPYKKAWISVRRCAQINKTSRAAADKPSLANAPGCDIWGPPVPIYMVTSGLGSEWSPRCRQIYITTKKRQRIELLAVGGSCASDYAMRDHFTMLHIAAHRLRDVSWCPLMGVTNGASLNTLHRMLGDEGGKARLTADIDLLMRADTIRITMPSHGGNATRFKQIVARLKGIARIWGFRCSSIEGWY